jgi:hypothetical protein
MYLTHRQLNGQIAFSNKRSLDVFDLKEGVYVKSDKLVLGLKNVFFSRK